MNLQLPNQPRTAQISNKKEPTAAGLDYKDSAAYYLSTKFDSDSREK